MTRRKSSRESGFAMTEYTIVFGFVACAALSALLVFGPRLVDVFAALNTYLDKLAV